MSKKAGQKCLRVAVGDHPISADEWAGAPELLPIYSEYVGCDRCVCAKPDDAAAWRDSDNKSMTEKCIDANLIHKVGHRVFGHGKYDMAKVHRTGNHNLEDTSMKKGFGDLAGVLDGINTYNLKQLLVGAGVGALGAIAANYATAKAAEQRAKATEPTIQKLWELAEIFGPLAALGGLGMYVAEKQFNVGLALAVAGGVLTGMKVKARYIDDSTQNAAAAAMLTAAASTNAAALLPGATEPLQGFRGIGSFEVLPRGLGALLPVGGFATQEESAWSDSPDGLNGNVAFTGNDWQRGALGSWMA